MAESHNIQEGKLVLLWKAVWNTCKKFPIEALLALTFLFFCILDVENKGYLDAFFNIHLLPYYFPTIILCFCLHRFSMAATKYKILCTTLYIASYFLWVPFLYITHIPHWLGVCYGLAVILLIAGCRLLENKEFTINATNTIVKLIYVEIICWLATGIIALILMSVELLFNLHFTDQASIRAYFYPTLTIALVVAPLLCCHLISKEDTELKIKKFISVVVNYILSATLVVYATILLIYIISIIVKWELPNGGVVYMVGSFCGLSLLCTIMRDALEKRTFNWFYKYLPAIALPPIILLWVGLYRRVNDYGITESRAYAIIITLLLTAFIAMLASKKTRKYQLMAVVFGVVIAAFTFIPGISAKDFALRSQTARLNNVLPTVLVSNQFPTSFNYEELKKDKSLAQSMLTAKAAYDYLKLNMDSDEFAAKYRGYGNFSLDVWELDNEYNKPHLVNSHTIIRNKQETDLGNYTINIPHAQYIFIQADEEWVFISDKNRADTLLRCNIKERYNTIDTSLIMTPETERFMTIYHNDKYLGIIRKISIYSKDTSIYTNEPILFRKPD